MLLHKERYVFENSRNVFEQTKLSLWLFLEVHKVWDVKVPNFGKVANFKCLLSFTPREIPGTHFCWRLSWPQGHSAAGRIR
jgi:hypothetical protein